MPPEMNTARRSGCEDARDPEALKIMVVDDEEPMRLLVEMLLAREGHDVVCCGDDRSAMRLLNGAPDLRVDLVVTDLRMPVHSGWDVIRAARGRIPGVGAILMTGSPDPDLPRKAALLGDCGLLIKPFRIDGFRKLVANMNLPGRKGEGACGPGPEGEPARRGGCSAWALPHR